MIHAGRARGLRCVIGRYHNVYGPRMGVDHVIPELALRAARREDPFRLYGADQRRAFCHVGRRGGGDAPADGHRGRVGPVVNVGNDAEETVIEDLAALVLRQRGPPPRPSSACRRRPARRSAAAPTSARLRALTGFSPKVPLETGVGETFDWYRAWAAGEGSRPVSPPPRDPQRGAASSAATSGSTSRSASTPTGCRRPAPFVDRFEREMAAYVGVPHAIATVNGSAALHVALRAAGVGPDDEVLLPTLTFIATAGAVDPLRRAPGVPRLRARVLGRSIRARRRRVPERASASAATGAWWTARPGAGSPPMLPVHLYGHPVRSRPAARTCAGGGRCRSSRTPPRRWAPSTGAAGSGCDGLVGCLSFNGNKIITTGGGGMVLTRDDGLAARVRALTTQARSDPLEWIHDEVAFNYRLTNVQAALGAAQLEQLEDFLEAQARRRPRTTRRRSAPSTASRCSARRRGRARTTGCRPCCWTRAAAPTCAR